ncbi:hypothetical protein K7432_014481 [Basidiobolus ranarum]|uniref:EF-hand domain-containing protein n=1 Tax=Basidiobolus ranarum TaxID=34480 RepID=A0ABR2WHK5_9FUNG
MKYFQLGSLWLLITVNWVTNAIPTSATETPARLHNSWHAVFEALDHDHDGLLSYNDLVCSSRISNDLSKCGTSLYSTQSSAVESRSDSLKQFYRMIKAIDSNGDGFLSFEELWMSVEKQKKNGKLVQLQNPEYEAFVEKSGKCMGSNSTCKLRFQMHLLSLNLGLSDRQVASCVINNPCENICACFEQFDHGQEAMTKSVNAQGGSHLSIIQARFIPLLALFLIGLIGLTLTALGAVFDTAWNSLPSNYYLDIAGSLGSASQNNCCAEYYWSDACGAPGSRQSQVCSRGGKLVNPHACDSLKAPASQPCDCGFLMAKCWFSPMKCKSLCMIENTGGCSCRLFEYDILKSQYFNGQVEYTMNTGKRGLCADWCSATSDCVGFNLQLDEKNKEQPLVCSFLRATTDGPHSSPGHVYFQKKQNLFIPGSDLDELRNAVLQFSKTPTCPNQPFSESIRSMYASTQLVSSPSDPTHHSIVISKALKWLLFKMFVSDISTVVVTPVAEILKSIVPEIGKLLGLLASVWAIASLTQKDLPLSQPIGAVNPPAGMTKDPLPIIHSTVCSLQANILTASSKAAAGNFYEMRRSQISMVQAGPGDSFVLTFYKFICDTSAWNPHRCASTDIDRVLIDGGRRINELKEFLDQADNIKINNQDQGYKVNYVVVTHLDLDHLGGITSLLRSDATAGTHYIGPHAHIMIDHPFDNLLRGSVGNAPMSAECEHALDALYAESLADWKAGTQPIRGIDAALVDFLWYTRSNYEVVSNRGVLGYYNQVTGLSMNVIGPSMDVIRRSLNSVNMCGGGALGEPEASEARNMISIMTQFDFARKTLLFTGDATSAAMESVWRSGLTANARRYDFLKVPHHASARTSSEADFRNLVGDIYMISGGNRQYMHPNKRALEYIITGRNAARQASPGMQTDFEVYLTNWDNQPGNNLDDLRVTFPPNQYHYSMYTLRQSSCSWSIDEAGTITKPVNNLDVSQNI